MAPDAINGAARYGLGPRGADTGRRLILMRRVAHTRAAVDARFAPGLAAGEPLTQAKVP
jgi:hypothetical protein